MKPGSTLFSSFSYMYKYGSCYLESVSIYVSSCCRSVFMLFRCCPVIFDMFPSVLVSYQDLFLPYQTIKTNY